MCAIPRIISDCAHRRGLTFETCNNGMPVSKHQYLKYCPSRAGSPWRESRIQVSLLCAACTVGAAAVRFLPLLRVYALQSNSSAMPCMWKSDVKCFLGHINVPYSLGFCALQGRGVPPPAPTLHGCIAAVQKLSYLRICKLEAKHGVDLGTTYRTETTGRSFVHISAEAKRQELVENLRKAKFFSLLLDGSTDAGNVDNELVLVVWFDHDGGDESVHQNQPLQDYETVNRQCSRLV